MEGSCGYYDNRRIAFMFLLLGGIPKLLSFVFFMSGASWLRFRMAAIGSEAYERGQRKADRADSVGVELTENPVCGARDDAEGPQY